MRTFCLAHPEIARPFGFAQHSNTRSSLDDDGNYLCEDHLSELEPATCSGPNRYGPQRFAAYLSPLRGRLSNDGEKSALPSGLSHGRVLLLRRRNGRMGWVRSPLPPHQTSVPCDACSEDCCGGCRQLVKKCEIATRAQSLLLRNTECAQAQCLTAARTSDTSALGPLNKGGRSADGDARSERASYYWSLLARNVPMRSIASCPSGRILAYNCHACGISGHTSISIWDPAACTLSANRTASSRRISSLPT